jgi:uncharacterized protein (DUF302 family)
MALKLALAVVLGLVVGAATCALLVYASAPRMMIVEDSSPLGHQATVDGIVAAAEARGWKVPAVHPLDESVAKAGHRVLPATVIEICHPDLAAQILADDDARRVASLMPCRVAVYTTSDGRVVVSRMNTGLMSRLFGGLVTRVMSQATGDSEAIVGAVLDPGRS